MEDFLKKAGDVLISSGLKLLLACLILIIGFKLGKISACADLKTARISEDRSERADVH